MLLAHPCPKQYLRVSVCQYPQAIYPQVTNTDNDQVDKREHRQRRVVELVAALYPGRGGVARMSRDCGLDGSYIRRLMYPPTKEGSKGLGEDIISTLESTYRLPRDWFDMPLGSELPAAPMPSESGHRVESHVGTYKVGAVPPSYNLRAPSDAAQSSENKFGQMWPFPNVDPARYEALSDGHKRAVQARVMEAIVNCEMGLIEPLPDTPRSKRSA